MSHQHILERSKKFDHQNPIILKDKLELVLGNLGLEEVGAVSITGKYLAHCFNSWNVCNWPGCGGKTL